MQQYSRTDFARELKVHRPNLRLCQKVYQVEEVRIELLALAELVLMELAEAAQEEQRQRREEQDEFLPVEVGALCICEVEERVEHH